MRITWANAAFLGFYMVSVGVATQVYKVGGNHAGTLFVWLAALGLTGSTFYAYLQGKFYERKQKAQEAATQAASGGAGAAAAPAAAPGELSGEVDLLVKDAEAKLAVSKIGQSGKLSEVPVIFMLGDRGATKTTVVMNSGMEPELLSGQVYQTDNQIAATRSANFWFAKKAVFMEAGGGLWSDAESWKHMLKKLSPGKLKSVFGGGGSAPRAAILCVDLERFLQQGASDTMAAVARSVSARLNEISTQFGISFPVYVLFTKADRVTFFHDFVRNLSTQESTQVFGVTLPMRATRGGVYAEEESQRLNNMFNELFYSLCDKRIEFLPRENDQEKLPGCYEFPREFRKLRGALVQFLVDVGRPSQLSASPFLRGFYFTGVRPVIIDDVAPTPIVQPSQPAFEGGGGATRMFRVGGLAQQPNVPMAAPQQRGGRKVPQWVFLGHLFNDVILEDKAALGASEASTKTSALQRFLLGFLAVMALIWSIGMTVSFFRNRTLESEVSDATRQIKAVRLAPNALPSIDDLKRLDSLRQKLEQLTDWKRDGAPWSYRWGLYVGNDMLPIVRKAYYDCFNQLLFSDTQSRILAFLRSRPAKAKEDDDYNYAYESLRAHLMTTSEWKRVEGQGEDKWLGNTLESRWIEGRESAVGEDRRALSELQFLFYGGDLHNGNPFSTREDADGVDKTRVFLASFSGFDRFYNAMLAEANKKNPAVNFNRKYSGSAAVVINNKDVPGAFTKQGWNFMQAAFKERSKKFGGEEWVLMSAKYKSAAAVPENLDQMLRERYTSDYIKTWRTYFSNTAVVGYSGPADAARKLLIHSDSRAPILALIGLASYNTQVDPAGDPYADRVRKAFQWAHVVVPPSQDLVYITGGNRPYTTGLSNLQIAVDAASKENPPSSAAAQSTQMRAQDALGMTRQVAAFSGQDLEGHLDQTILRIMEAPIKDVDGLFSPAKMLNAAGGAMCSQFNVITNKFPFNPNAQPEVQINELNDLLRPGTGKFWQFYEGSLKQFLQKQGATYVAVSGAGVTMNPVFVNFFNQVARLSDAFYRGGQDPRLAYTVQLNGVDLVLNNTQAKSGSITIDGKAAKLGAPAVAYTWTGSPSHSVLFEYNDSPAFNRQGPWAVFHFFVDAQVSAQGNTYLLVWPVRGGTGNNLIANARFTVDLSGAPAVFDKRFFAGLRCISTVATK
ncbi:MAG: hypothetical protein IANPNBLG_02141 [Bryobacteraceae bacterium]|nr:hypothetical protein [Bryobacteraceae bacterium]